jgi:uncharacterized repeat protein (TIGR01451 family)
LKVRDCATTTIASAAAASPSPAAPLDVSITPVQATATVGDRLNFEVALRNRSTTPMTKIGLRVRLDPGLEHRSADQRGIVERVLPSLAPGEIQRLGVEIRVTRPGRLALNFEATAPNAAPVSVQAAVTAVGGTGPSAPGAAAAPLSVTMIGPPKSLTVGDKAQFTIDVKNTSSTTLQNVQVVDRCDSALVQAKATDGWKIANDSLVWNIDTLLAGQVARFVVECTCQAPSAKAYNHITVALPDGSRTGSEAFLEILPLANPKREAGKEVFPDILKKDVPPGQTVPPPAGPTPPAAPAGEGLSLSVVGLSNPVHPGDQLTYEIRVVNKGTAPYQQVAVTALAPLGMTPIALGSVGAKFDGQIIRFDPARELAPGNTLTYRVRVSAKQLGNYRFHVEVTALGMPKPKTQDADETEVRN